VKWLLGGLAAAALLVFGGPWVLFNVIESPAPPPLHLPAVGAAVVPGPVSGSWRVTTGSEAGYRVQEVLLGQHRAAVGRTSRVSGGIVVSGTTVTNAEFSVDMADVKSDQTSRDAQFRGYIMETYKYRDARFRLTQPIQLGSIPDVGTPVTVQATGDLTMRGVTRGVTFPLTAERAAGGIDINAAIPITFSGWHIPNPTFAVAQVGDSGTLEVLLRLEPSS